LQTLNKEPSFLPLLNFCDLVEVKRISTMK
jgi:hypothetical protein